MKQPVKHSQRELLAMGFDFSGIDAYVAEFDRLAGERSRAVAREQFPGEGDGAATASDAKARQPAPSAQPAPSKPEVRQPSARGAVPAKVVSKPVVKPKAKAAPRSAPAVRAAVAPTPAPAPRAITEIDRRMLPLGRAEVVHEGNRVSFGVSRPMDVAAIRRGLSPR